MGTARGNHYLRVIGRLADGATPASARAEMDQIGRELMKTYPTTNTASVVVASLQDELIRRYPSASVDVLRRVGAGAVARSREHREPVALARTSRRRACSWIRSGARGEPLLADDAAHHRERDDGPRRRRDGPRVRGDRHPPARRVRHDQRARHREHADSRCRDRLRDSAFDGHGRDLRTGAGVASGTRAVSRAAWGTCAALPDWKSRARGRGSWPARWRWRCRCWLARRSWTQTLIREQRVDPGFDAAHALQFRVTLADTRYQDSPAKAAFFALLTSRLAALPGARSAGIVTSLPLGGLNDTGATFAFDCEDGTPAALGMGFRAATSGYFAALNVPLRRGRLFTDADADKSSVFVNERAAQGDVGRRGADWPAREVRPAGGFAGQGHLAHGGRGCRRPASRDADPPAES